MSEPNAVQKMQRAHDLIKEAEGLLQDVTAADLEAAGWEYDGEHKNTMPRNLVYDVFAHATGLKLVREHLFASFLT